MQIIVVMLVLYYSIIMIQILLVREKIVFSSSLICILVKRGDRIAQLICEKIEMADLVEEDVCIF